MADSRNDLTNAEGITADLVLELGKYFSAQDMRSVQTRMTTAARELRALSKGSSLIGRLGEKLSYEQRELLLNAAALVDSIKYNVEHAKEIKAREEKVLAKKREKWDREADQLVQKHFSLPAETVTEQLQILELYLVARAVLGYSGYLKDYSSLRKVMQGEPPRWSHVTTLAQWRRSEVGSLQADLRTAIREYLSWDLKVSPAKRLEETQEALQAQRVEVLSQPQSVDLIRIWTDALKGAAFITSVLPSGSAAR